MQLLLMLGLPVGLVIWGLCRLAVLRDAELRRVYWFDVRCEQEMMRFCTAHGRPDLMPGIIRQNR